MRLTRFLLLAPAAAALAACNDDTTQPENPPLAYVRYVHAMPDTGTVDVRLVDRVENFIVTVGASPGYGAVGPFNGIAAGTRHFRVFTNMGSTNPSVVSQVIHEEQVTLNPNTYYTILHTGYARAGQTPADRFVVIEETMPTTAAGQAAIRPLVVTPNIGPVDVYTPRTDTSATPATPRATNVAYATSTSGAAANWFTFAADTSVRMAVRATNTGTTTVVAQGNAPNGSTGGTQMDPAAGVTVPGSALTAFIFGPGVAGSPNGSRTSGSVSYGVDKRPPR